MPNTETVVAIIAGVFAVISAAVAGRLNWKTVRSERTLPPYEALAERVGTLEAEAKEDRAELREEREKREELEERAEYLEDAVKDLKDDLSQDREWIKDVIVTAEGTGAIERIKPLPAWIDLESDSMRQRRQQREAKS